MDKKLQQRLEEFIEQYITLCNRTGIALTSNGHLADDEYADLSAANIRIDDKCLEVSLGWQEGCTSKDLQEMYGLENENT